MVKGDTGGGMRAQPEVNERRGRSRRHKAFKKWELPSASCPDVCHSVSQWGVETSEASGDSFLEEEGTQGDTHTGHLHPICPEGPELTFKLPLTDVVLKYQRNSNGSCLYCPFLFHQLLVAEVALGPRELVHENSLLAVPAMSLKLIQPS